MRKTNDPALFKAITEFMKVYAPVIRRRSTNTIKSYACALNSYFDFLEAKRSVICLQLAHLILIATI